MRRLFHKGGPLEKFFPVFDMLETMLYVKPEPTRSGAHIRDRYDIKRMMVIVIIACLPAFVFGIYNTGYQHFLSAGIKAGVTECFTAGLKAVLPILIVSYAVGGFWEIVFAVVRRHEVNEGFLVSGFLIACIVPASVPLWQVAVAVSFAVVIGKEIFGGTGMNIFNPALVARAFLFFAYPASLSGDGVWTLTAEKIVDTYTMATPLSAAVANTGTPIVEALTAKGYTFSSMFLGLIPGSIGETSTLAILLGAGLLLITGVASWRIMLMVFAGGFLTAISANFAASSPASITALPAHYHLVTGGFAFGAVFMATDPVTACATNAGKYIYGFMIGALAIIVRLFNPAYPEGMMLAILFLNAFAPLIDDLVVRAAVKRRMKRAAG
jgi:Na+-transporting NADH:ubiquinone oxidoreductase subunit B